MKIIFGYRAHHRELRPRWAAIYRGPNWLMVRFLNVALLKTFA